MLVEMMTGRSQALAEQFEQTNLGVIAVVEQCSDAQWHAICPDEGWSVAVTANHIGWAHGVILGWVQSIAAGQGMPAITMEQINEVNHQRTEQLAGCTKAETLELIRAGGVEAAAAVRGLTDEELDRSAPVGLLDGQVLTAEQMITFVLIGHAQRHLASIRSALVAG
jgi:uncharacterized damage-inducible protein DinB